MLSYGDALPGNTPQPRLAVRLGASGFEAPRTTGKALRIFHASRRADTFERPRELYLAPFVMLRKFGISMAAERVR